MHHHKWESEFRCLKIDRPGTRILMMIVMIVGMVVMGGGVITEPVAALWWWRWFVLVKAFVRSSLYHYPRVGVPVYRRDLWRNDRGGCRCGCRCRRGVEGTTT